MVQTLLYQENSEREPFKKGIVIEDRATFCKEQVARETGTIA